MDHFLNPRNMGDLEDADGIGEVGAAACGDIMKISLKIDDNGRISDAKFKTFGCGSAIASSSMATELVKGKTIEEALQLSNKNVVDALGGLPPVKIHCSVLAEEAIKAALDDYLKRHPDMDSKCTKNGRTQFFTTENEEKFAESASVFLKTEINVKGIELE